MVRTCDVQLQTRSNAGTLVRHNGMVHNNRAARVQHRTNNLTSNLGGFGETGRDDCLSYNSAKTSVSLC